MTSLDALVIGAGAVGLAVGRELARRRLSVAVVDQAARPGELGSSHNSEIIHAGLYYPDNSLKASLCVEGRDRLYHYCAERQIPHLQCGKLVVATDAAQVEHLERLKQQGERNGAGPLTWMATEQLHREEPWLRATAALHSPLTGILDSHALVQSLRHDFESAEGVMALRSRVTAVDCREQPFRVQLRDDRGDQLVNCRLLINAAGLHATELAQRFHGLSADSVPQTRYARGNYFSLQGPAPTHRPVYPVPDEDGLGVHLTVDLGGQARFGPDVEWVDNVDFAVNTDREQAFYEAVRRYYPNLPDGRLHPDYAGVRPKLFQEDRPYRDFMIQTSADHGIDGLINLFGIESPGLTACLALAHHVSNRL
jgi:L-2-hydroxyglutarate oxidase LhgO